MLRLQDDRAIYNNIEDLGLVKDLDYIEGGFRIVLSDGSIFMPQEEDSPPEQMRVFQAYHEFYEDFQGVRPMPIPEPQIFTEPVDEEKAAMAEAIIDMSLQINELKEAIEMLKGGD